MFGLRVPIAFLWYNVIGCVAVLAIAWAATLLPLHDATA
jgi:hypothetical protein